jgi:hypothetical protein
VVSDRTRKVALAGAAALLVGLVLLLDATGAVRLIARPSTRLPAR